MIQNIKLLIENLFDDDLDSLLDLNNNEDNIFNSDAAKRAYQVDFYDKMVELLGTDKPRGWKKLKDKDGNQILQYKQNPNGRYIYSYVNNVLNILQEHNFKILQFKNRYSHFAYYYGFTDFRKFIKDKRFIHEFEHYAEHFIDRCVDEYKQDLIEIQKFPLFVQNILKNNQYIEKLAISPDNGIIFTLESSFDIIVKTQHYWSNDTIHIATLKFTNEVLYKDIKDVDKTLKNNKDNEKKISYLTAKLNKTGLIGSYYGIRFTYKIDSDGYPCGIYKFDWKKELLSATNAFKKYNIPKVVETIYKKGFHYVPVYEKEDENSIFEFQKDSLLVKIYKNGNEGIVYVCLTDYLKEHYKKIFNIEK